MTCDQKKVALLKEKRASSGLSSSPACVIVLFNLSSSTNSGKVARDLLMLSSGEDTEPLSNTIASSIYKFRLTVLEAPHGNLLSCMELAKVADLIAFVVSANSLGDEYETSTLVDAFGQQYLSVFRAIGLPSTAVLIWFMWLFKEQSLSCPHWRNQRPYLVSQETQLEPDKDNPGMCSLLLSGHVRAHSLSANQLAKEIFG